MLRLKGERGQDKVFLEAHCVFLVGASKESQKVQTSDKTDRVLPSFDPGFRRVFLFHCCHPSEALLVVPGVSSVMTEQACQGPTFFLVNAYAEKSLYSPVAWGSR